MSFVASVFPKGGVDFKYEVTMPDDEIASIVTLFFLLFFN